MTGFEYVTGVLGTGLFAGGLGLGAHALRLRLVPGWAGPPAWLAAAALAVGGAIVAGAALGAIGVFERWALLAVGALSGSAGALDRRRTCGPDRVPAAQPDAPARHAPRGSGWVALAATAVVAANWSARSYEALREGMPGVDTLWYHMPFAARIAQDGSIHSLAQTQPEPLTLFYPLNAEVVHAIGIELTGYDALSPILNLGWLALALLAAWCIGARFGVAPLTLLAADVLLGSWLMTWSQAGEASNDVTGIALLLAATALAVNARGDARALMAAALPAALAMGTKVSLVAGVAALFGAVIAAAPRDARRAVAGAWLAAGAVVGGFWYWRNLVVTGNPVPAVGALGLPAIQPDPALESPAVGVDSTLAALVTEDGARRTITTGLRADLGPAWWAVVTAAAAGLAAAALGRGRLPLVRGLGLTGLVVAAAYVVTPQSGDSFVVNVRHAVPALMLGLMLLPVTVARRGAVLGGLAVLFVTTQLAGGIRPPAPALAWWGALIAAAAVVPLVARPRLRAPGAALAVAAAVLAGYPLQRDHVENRYGDPAADLIAGAREDPLLPIFAWAGTREHERIAIYGTQLQYPLYGRDLSNRVRYLHHSRDHGRVVERIRSCRAWQQAVAASGAHHVLVTPVRFPFGAARAEPPEARWTRALPGAREIAAAGGQVFLFAVDPRRSRAGSTHCGSAREGPARR